MRFALFTAVALFSTISLTACDHSHDEGYDTLQLCFDEHTGGEGYSAAEAITICTLEHPLGGVTLEFADIAACIAYVDANLATDSATTADVMAGCQDYIDQKGM